MKKMITATVYTASTIAEFVKYPYSDKFERVYTMENEYGSTAESAVNYSLRHYDVSVPHTKLHKNIIYRTWIFED